MNNINRIKFIDLSKGIGIIIVVMGHIAGEGGRSFEGSSLFRGYIYSFHMALFFILSGILLNNYFQKYEITNESLKRKITSLIKRLLITYFLWHIIYFMISSISNTNIDLHEWVICTLSFRGRAPIWFLGALFWAELISVLIISLAKNNRLIIRKITIAIFLLNVAMLQMYNYIDESNLLLSYIEISIFRSAICIFFILFGYVVSDMLFTTCEAKTDLKCVGGASGNMLNYIFGV